ncbi:MAG TPA: tRNA(fMet)-specific endonuclease VapC [Alphaproteobacteria bacterium]
MLRYMLDTDICIYALKDRPATLRGRFNRLAEQICISAVTLAELAFGAERSARPSENLAVVSLFVGQLDVLPFGERAAMHYGNLRAELARKGRPTGPYDLMICAHARSEGLILVTNNVRDFERMNGLRIENWAK